MTRPVMAGRFRCGWQGSIPVSGFSTLTSTPTCPLTFSHSGKPPFSTLTPVSRSKFQKPQKKRAPGEPFVEV